jgi:hypothetical protein
MSSAWDQFQQANGVAPQQQQYQPRQKTLREQFCNQQTACIVLSTCIPCAKNFEKEEGGSFVVNNDGTASLEIKLCRLCIDLGMQRSTNYREKIGPANIAYFKDCKAKQRKY